MSPGSSASSALRNLAVVGSRNATAYGIETTRSLCQDITGFGFNIVSGMAVGIDTAAHHGAMDGKGRTYAVLGSGLEWVYPRENLKLFHRIAENGAVLSEFPLKTEPDGFNFPRRNRIISGMSLGTVVVEATLKSGSLITARLAAEQNREVFAVPGSVRSFKSTGTHTLIKQGAKLVEHARDIIEELPPEETTRPSQDDLATATREVKSDLSPEEKKVLDIIEPYPIHIDTMIRHLGMESGKLASILLPLELKGIIRQAPGKYFTRS